MRFLCLAILFSSFSTFSFAATDSLIVKGRILNLNGRLYRQAPTITFSRNNILQPQSELSKQTNLEADGTFRVSLPILFAQEEFYLDYSGKAFTTFLGSPGTVEITFDGDSLAKASRLFYFAGVNADANNQFPQYLAAENKLLTANKALGADFFRNFWGNGPSAARQLAQQRAQLRFSAVKEAAKNTVPSPALNNWVKSLTDEEQLQILYEHALSNEGDIAKNLLDSLKRLSQPPLTAQRVIWANRFGNYADLEVAERKFTNPSKTNSLPVRLMATLIRDNAVNLTGEETARLEAITRNGLAEKTELDFLNKLFAKNEMVLNLLFNYERESRIYSELFDSTATEFLKIRYLAKNLFRYTYKQQLILNQHIQSRNGIPVFRQSLDEIVQLEVKDSSDIRKIVDYKNVTPDPSEALPGYFLAASNDRGTAWFNRVLDQYKGKTVYLIKWNLEDAKSREELDFIPALQASVPDDVVFLYVHLPNDEFGSSDALLRQYILRHRLKGTHLFMSNDQMMDLIFRLNPLDSATFSLIRPNGKFAAKNASAPSNTEKTINAILDAGK